MMSKQTWRALISATTNPTTAPACNPANRSAFILDGVESAKGMMVKGRPIW
jgi:hypothetical protein